MRKKYNLEGNTKTLLMLKALFSLCKIYMNYSLFLSNTMCFLIHWSLDDHVFIHFHIVQRRG